MNLGKGPRTHRQPQTDATADEANGNRDQLSQTEHLESRKGHSVYPYLPRGLEFDRANQVWVADVTHLPMVKGFAYLVAIMDLYSREVLSWQLSNTLDLRFCVAAPTEVRACYGLPEVINTDQGAQFTSLAFTSVLDQHGVRISKVPCISGYGWQRPLDQ